MIIENTVLKKMAALAKAERPETGIYIQGIKGGVEIYAFNGHGLYWKVLPGDNQREFIQYIQNWTDGRVRDKRFCGKVKAAVGYTVSEAFTNSESIKGSSRVPAEMIKIFRSLLVEEECQTEAFVCLKGREFFPALRLVDSINKGERKHPITLSFHNGFLNVAAWTSPESYTDGEEFGIYEEVAPAPDIEGAVMLNYMELKSLNSTGNITIELIRNQGTGILRFRTAEMDATIMPMTMAVNQFKKVLGYDYQAPAVIKEVLGADAWWEKEVQRMIVSAEANVGIPVKVKAVPKITAEVPTSNIIPFKDPEKPVAQFVVDEPKKFVSGTGRVKKLQLYGDINGRWLSVPKTLMSRYELWDKVSNSALETKVLICPVWGPESEAILEVLKTDGWEIEIESHIVAGKSSMSRLPHYQGNIKVAM